MTITLNIIPDAQRGQFFSHTVVATPTAQEVISSITITPTNLDSGVSVAGSTISGEYIDLFLDTVKFVDWGSSDILNTDVTVIGTGNIPVQKTIYSLIEDSRFSASKTYDIIVTHSLGVYNETISHTVLNNIGSGMTFLTNYIADNHFEF